MLWFALFYTKLEIEDCYTTNSVVTYDKENAQLILDLAPSNNELCAVFPPSVNVLVTFQVSPTNVLFEKIFYDFEYETTRELMIPCDAGNTALCNTIDKATLGIVQIESIIDVTRFSAGAVVLRVSDTESCLENNRNVIVEQNRLVVKAYSTGKCDLYAYEYKSARATVYYNSGTSEQLTNSNTTIDMTQEQFDITFAEQGVMILHATDRISRVVVTIIGLKTVAGLTGELPFFSNSIAFEDAESIGLDIFGFYESEMVTYTFTYNSSNFVQYATDYEFMCNSIIYDTAGESQQIETNTTYSEVISGSVMQSCRHILDAQKEGECRDILAAVLENPQSYTAEVEVLVFLAGKLVYGAEQYITSPTEFRISCYGNMEITLFAKSAALIFSKNPRSTLCDSQVAKQVMVAGFSDEAYSNPVIIAQLSLSTIDSPIQLPTLTAAQMSVFKQSMTAGIIVIFVNDTENRQDKCLASQSSIFRLDLSKFYLEGGITMGVTCIVGILLAIADMALVIYCKTKRQNKKVFETLDLDL